MEKNSLADALTWPIRQRALPADPVANFSFWATEIIWWATIYFKVFTLGVFYHSSLSWEQATSSAINTGLRSELWIAWDGRGVGYFVLNKSGNVEVCRLLKPKWWQTRRRLMLTICSSSLSLKQQTTCLVQNDIFKQNLWNIIIPYI